jgi:autotransporter-associated beta strand protein
VFVYDGSTLTLQGATTKGMPAGRGGGDPYRYSVVNGTLVLDNNNSLINNNPTGTGFNQAWFLLGAATSVFSPTINGRATPAPGVLVDTDNSFNATVYLGDANYPDGGLSVSADLPTHLSDGDAGFVNRGVFTIGGQNTNGINTYNNSIILGLTANVGKSVTLVAATGGEVDFAGGLLANGDDKTAGVTVGDAAHGGIVKLTATNTYGGNTFITNGTLALGGAGSIVKSGSIVLAGGTTFDVSGLSHAFNLGSGQTLSNKAPTARLNGNVNTGPGIVSLTYASGTPSLTVSNGTLNLAKMTVFKVNNTGTALASGSYKIISAQITGRITALTGLPAVSVGGGGIAADGTAALQITRGELYLVVKGNASPESAF